MSRVVAIQLKMLWAGWIACLLCSSPIAAQGFDYNWLAKVLPDEPGTIISYDDELETLVFDTFQTRHRFFENQMISDSAGNPLFFSSGLQLWLDFDELMPGGDSMFINIGLAEEFYQVEDYFPYIGGDWLLSNILPLQNGDYLYLHYSLRDQFSSGFDIDIIDTAGWAVITYCEDVYRSFIRRSGDELYVEAASKMELITEGQFVASSNTLIKHANGIDWWLYLPEVVSDSVRVLLIDGVDGSLLQEDQYVFSPSNQLATSTSDLLPSPDGTQMVRFVYRNGGQSIEMPYFRNLLEFYDVDRCTGVPVLRSYQWMDNFIRHGVTADIEWSPSGRFIYIAYNQIILQVDMEAEEPWADRDTVAVWVENDPDSPNVIFFGDLQVLPNGQMLVSGFGYGPFMHLIRSPDLPGDLCDFSYKHFAGPCSDPDCESRLPLSGIPRWVPFRMGPLEGDPCVTSTEPEPSSAVLSLRAYPSPAREVVYLKSSEDLHGKHFMIHDTQGRLVSTVTYRDGLDVSGLSAGIYLIHGVDIRAVSRFTKIGG